MTNRGEVRKFSQMPTRSTLRSVEPPLKTARMVTPENEDGDESVRPQSASLARERRLSCRGGGRGRIRGRRGRGRGTIGRHTGNETNNGSLNSEAQNTCSTEDMDWGRGNNDVENGSVNHGNSGEGNTSNNSIGIIEMEVNMEEFRRLQEDVRQLKAENSRLTVLMNEYKVSASEKRQEALSKEVSIKALESEVMRLDCKSTELRGTVQSLGILNEELLKKMSESNKSRGKYVDRMISQVPTKYLGIGLAVDQRIQKWGSKETCELDPFCDGKVRNWTNRAEIVSEHGIKVLDGTMIVPTPFTVLCSGNNIYVPSVNSERDMICLLLRKEMSAGESVQIYPSEESRNAVVEAFCKVGTLEGRMRQLLSDFCSGRKRAAKDRCFEALGYSSLLSRFNLKERGAMEKREKEICTAKSKLLKRNRFGVMDMSWWRTSDITDIRLWAGVNQRESVVDEEEEDEEKLNLFRNEIGPAVLHDFIGYIPENGEGEPVEGTVMSIARVDAWINSCVNLLILKEYRGGGRQKEFNRMFSMYLKVASEQLVGKIRKFVESWEPHELEVPECEVGEEEEHFRNMERDATVIVTTIAPRKHFIAVKSEWYCKYIGMECGIIHDCYIAEISSDWKSVEKLGNEYVEGPVRSTLFESEGSIESNRSIERNEEAETVQL